MADTLRLRKGLSAVWALSNDPRFRRSIEQNFLPDIDTFYSTRLTTATAGGARGTRGSKSGTTDSNLHNREAVAVPGHREGFGRVVRRVYLYIDNHLAMRAAVNAGTLSTSPLDGEREGLHFAQLGGAQAGTAGRADSLNSGPPRRW